MFSYFARNHVSVNTSSVFQMEHFREKGQESGDREIFLPPPTQNFGTISPSLWAAQKLSANSQAQFLMKFS